MISYTDACNIALSTVTTTYGLPVISEPRDLGPCWVFIGLAPGQVIDNPWIAVNKETGATAPFDFFLPENMERVQKAPWVKLPQGFQKNFRSLAFQNPNRWTDLD